MPLGKKILLSPLDWGLGHTTRCIPIIRELITRGHHITIACNGFQKQFLESYNLPIRFVHIEGYNVTYHNKGSMVMKMAGQIPRIVQKIKEENNWVKEHVKENEVDIIISDNRFGFYHNLVESIYITHQINIRANSLVSPMLYKLHDMIINNFHHCWIPDTPENDFAGDLSAAKNESYQYVGLLSRFSSSQYKIQTKKSSEWFDYTAILSGPEPQRSLFEKILINEFTSSPKKLLLVGGALSEKKYKVSDNISYRSLSSADDFEDVLGVTQRVIARSGYSTIMDMAFLQLPVYFVPTPGQTEQEYLAALHKIKSGTNWINQSNFIIPEFESFNTLSKPSSNNEFLLKTVLNKVGL
jgi:predicted glycosyltransferase